MSNQPTTNKSAERIQFLEDVMVTAVEGGIGYWCQIESWSEAATKGRTEVKIVALAEDDETVLPIIVNLDDLARGIGILRRDETNTHESYVKQIMEASRENDAGEIDAELADLIFQAAALGDTIYG